VPVASLVGYTNAGKSTLLNRLTGAGVVTEDKMFSTLDPVTRRVSLPSGREMLLTDTVGFIQKLPTNVVAAFRATLEEAEDAALIVQVLDITHPNAAEQAEVVSDILSDLGLADKPRLLALNKIDMLGPEDEVGATIQSLAGDQARAVFVSGLAGTGLDLMLREMDRILSGAPAGARDPQGIALHGGGGSRGP
jgi:GTP-binding protein HflX